MNRSDQIAIVGGGLAGLAAGIALLRQGRQVTLLEAGSQLGGCCTTTQASGFTFNNGAVYVALPELLDTAFERLGMDRASLLPLKQITRLHTARVADEAVVTFRPGGHVHVLPADGPLPLPRDPEHDVRRLLEKWRPLLDLLTNDVIVRPFSLPRLLWKGWRELPKLRGTVADELNRMVADPAVRAALGSVTLYTGLPPEKTPVMQLVGVIAMLADKFYLPEGGMGRISEVLATEFSRLGGQAHLHAPVERIVVQRGRATGVVVGGSRIAADAVLSTTSAMTTYRDLLDTKDVPAAMLKKVASSPLSQKALSVQLGLRNQVDADSHFMGCIPRMEWLNGLLEPSPGKPCWLSYTVPTVTLPDLAPDGGSVIEMYPAIDQSIRAQDWTQDRAARTAESAIELLSRRHAMDIAVTRVRSPKDFQSDMRLFAGAIYGLSPAADPRAQFTHKSPIAGLYLAGQTTYPGYGVAPAMLGGIFAAAEVR